MAVVSSACEKEKPMPSVPAVTSEMSFTVDGAAVAGRTSGANYTDSTFLVTGGVTTPSQQLLTIRIPNLTGAGTYLNGTLTYSLGTVANTWSASPLDPGSSNSVVFTEFNTTTRKATGTFTATAVPAPGSTVMGTQVITGGKFTNVSF